LIINIFSSYHISHSRITPIINIKEIYLNINTAIPCGLLINEIVTNSIKHGFNGNKKGEIIINMKEGKDNYFHLEISNNGEGLPDGIDYTNPESTGMELIRILILQLSADADLVKENGVLYKLKFKKLKN
ncbi:MAG: histidine kinase, partial [Candidatus Cloacimonetes bacterium]|nr:histidine kinase [Candidatus Cloacimonadota bacterium]